MSKFSRFVLVLFLCHIPHWNIRVFFSCAWSNVTGVSTVLSIPTYSPKGEQCALKHLIPVCYQMLMFSEILGEVLCSSNLYSTLQHRKLLGETPKGFVIQTRPPVESTCKRAEVRNGLISFIDGISEPLDNNESITYLF